jgi:TetR/AcrR family transcriptional repressor of lmrAB and yxaGH operons
MPAKKIDEDYLMDKLTEVFRLHGYEGSSLSRISEATGLKRASLYHRFPGGKEEMAEAVLQRADDWFGSHILAPLAEPGEPSSRVKEMAKRLSDFYRKGNHSCLLDSLSIGDEDVAIRQHIEKSFNAWLGALIAISRAAGLSAAVAKERAEEALIRIQGALVMARATGETKAFARILQNLPQLLTLDSKQSKPKH